MVDKTLAKILWTIENIASLEELRDKLVDIEKHIKRLGITWTVLSHGKVKSTGTGDIHDPTY